MATRRKRKAEPDDVRAGAARVVDAAALILNPPEVLPWLLGSGPAEERVADEDAAWAELEGSLALARAQYRTAEQDAYDTMIGLQEAAWTLYIRRMAGARRQEYARELPPVPPREPGG